MRSVQSKDISITWTSFLMKIVGLWLAADKVERRRRDFALIYTLNAIFIATCIAIRDIYFSWGNFADCVFISCNILYLTIVLFKIVALCAHKTEFHDLMKFTKKNFWHLNYDFQENLILSDCKRKCVTLVIVVSFCAQGTCAGYMVTPIIANIGKNESERVLPFNMWLDFPTGVSPYFEVLFTIQILCVYHVGICYICFDNLLCIINLHVASQFRILQYRLRNLNKEIGRVTDDTRSGTKLSNYTAICYIKLKNCVQHHQILTDYCRQLENVFALIVLGQVLFLGMVICLVGYQLFLADTPPSRNVSLVLNFGGTICQLYMFTYSCDGLIRQSVDVGQSAFCGPWASLSMDKAGKIIRQNMIIIIMRSNRSSCLTAGGFFPVSLETYTAVLSTAMSYFTLLRQSTLDLVNT